MNHDKVIEHYPKIAFGIIVIFVALFIASSIYIKIENAKHSNAVRISAPISTDW